MQLTKTRAVPSGMSFDLTVGSNAPAYVLSTPGNAVMVGLNGNGAWVVEVLASVDGLDYTVLATLTTPGHRRYETRGVVALAVRAVSFVPVDGGLLMGMLSHGQLIPSTNVSPVFGSFLTFSYNNSPTEPPSGNQVRFNNANFTQATKCWISNTTVDLIDQYYAVRHVPYGGTLLLQNKTDHNGAVLFGILAPPIDRGAYVEVPVVYQQGITTLNSQQVILAVFAPGASMSFAGVATDAWLDPDILPVSLEKAGQLPSPPLPPIAGASATLTLDPAKPQAVSRG
jgi:hypothetical protein